MVEPGGSWRCWTGGARASRRVNWGNVSIAFKVGCWRRPWDTKMAEREEERRGASIHGNCSRTWSVQADRTMDFGLCAKTWRHLRAQYMQKDFLYATMVILVPGPISENRYIFIFLTQNINQCFYSNFDRRKNIPCSAMETGIKMVAGAFLRGIATAVMVFSGNKVT